MTTYPWAAGYIDDGDRPKVVTSRFHLEDSYTLERYLATGGYEGLKSALARPPTAIHDDVKAATVLGRGGAGFPAGTKWGLTPQGVWPRYLVVNGDESEPGTYKDRLLMERDPHQLIEGCLIASYAAGLSQCFLYIRGEMALAQERVATALNEAYAAGYVGKNILGSDFSIDIVLHWGAGAYVVGEETALIESLEGKRGEPRLKPPFFPAAVGLYGRPTIVNNVETLANLPWLMVNGPAAYTAIGTATSPGTRMVAVSGHVQRPGVYEIINGTTTFRDLLYGDEFCQGIRNGNELKAFVPGGGSAPWFTPEQLDLPFEGKLVGAAGSMLGSGAIMVMDHTTDIPAAALTLTRFYAHESCGQCTPCREGGTWLERVLSRVVDGRGTHADLDQMFEIGESICPGTFPHAASTELGLAAAPFPYKMTTICFVGPSAYAPVHSALTLFRSEFEAKIVERKRIPVSAEAVGAHLMTTTEPIIETDAPPPDPNAVQVTINGVPHTARKGQLVIEAAADAGEYIPRFCYHERMTSVGKCRMCLVECDSGRGPAVTVSCMVPVAPDMKIDTQGENTKRMQEGVLELLLANHPLDCPVCDKGGECPLQDQTVSSGPGESRYVEEKRHYEKPIAISDIVYLDRERCILCDRCTRFADEVAGDALIHFSGRGNNTYITTYPDEPFSSYFSGNTVQICPVGALTAKPYRFKARPWDLVQQESTCTTCSVGCRTVVQSSNDELLRYMGVDSEPVNHGWLCDRGRFNFESVKSDGRVVQPMVRNGDTLEPTSWSTAFAAAATLILEAKAAGGADSIAVIGGARGTNEDAFAWARLGHEVIGTPNVYSQMGDGLPVGLLGLDRATIDDAANATTIVLLGPDLKEELPVLYLRLRAAAEKKRSKIIEFAPKQTGLSRYAWRQIGYEPGTQVAAVQTALADPAIAEQLGKGSVVIVAGRANLAESSAATIAALRVLLGGAPGAKVLPAFRRGNVVGALQVGFRPGKGGLDTRGALQAAADGKIDCLVLLGADPLTDFPDSDLARRALAGARRIIAIDTFLTKSSSLANVVLAASAYGEKAGTTTNLEGRVSTVARQVTPAGSTRPDWMIATELALELGGDLGYGSVEDVTADIAAKVDGFADVTAAALAADSNGVLTGVPADIDPINTVEVVVAERNAYDFRLVVSRTLYDEAVGTATSPSLAHLPRGSALHLHPLDLERVGTTAGTDVKVIGPRSTVIFSTVADESVLRGTAFVPFNNPGPNVGELIDCFAAVNDVRIENL